MTDMEIVIRIAIGVACFIFGLILKSYLPSYMETKGRNLATKQDIQEITRKTEEIQNEFRKDMESFSFDIKFKYDFYYQQYSKLYANLYSVICQSEYMRRFLKLYDGTELTEEKIPFIEIHKSKYRSEFKFGSMDSGIEQTKEKTHDDITKFCKKSMCDLIISNGEFATQELLKLAVAYRFVYDNYSGNDKIMNPKVLEVANDEEFVMIRAMVHNIITEFNFLRRELRMTYEENELKTGLFQSVIICN